MGTGSHKTHNHAQGFREEIRKVSQSDPNSFFNWFNESGGDKEKTFLKGQDDFLFHILQPALPFIQKPNTLTALEIGYGGGRLVTAATRVFQHVIGIDLHEEQDMVEKELRKRGSTNFRLFTSKGDNIPVDNVCVDFVYSLIVLQHVERLSVFTSYVGETHRVLKDGGVAILYFGRLSTWSVNHASNFLYRLDQLSERLRPNTYQEIFERVNAVNLKISLPLAKQIAQQIGFTILGEGTSKKLPNQHVYGGQSFLILKKEQASL